MVLLERAFPKHPLPGRRPTITFFFMTQIFVRLLLAAFVFLQVPLRASSYEAAGSDGISHKVNRAAESLQISFTGGEFGRSGQSVYAAVGTGPEGSIIVPFGEGREGSTVFLPFKASLIVIAKREGEGFQTTVRRWNRTQWGEAADSKEVSVALGEGGTSVTLGIPNSLIGDAAKLRLAAWCKDLATEGGWGYFYGCLAPNAPSGTGEITLRNFLEIEGGGEAARYALRSRGHKDVSKIRIYQMLPRLFGNTNETRKENGFLEDNGVGKFNDLDETAIAEIKKLGASHIWLTGVHQQATSTDYSAIGEPADDPDLLKGLAGSPYAIRDYFDVSPDYAVDPAKRMEEFQAAVSRIHAAGMKVLIDFVPNHVARSYNSTVRPELSFGATDDRSKFFSPENNFFWLAPSADGPPLRLPTVDEQGNVTSPTSKVARAKSDGLFEPEKEFGRVTGDNAASWRPSQGNWYETVKLNYGFDFTDKDKKTREYPYGDHPDKPIPDTWKKMDEIVAHWQAMGVDGFRVDMAHMVPPEFWHWMIARARERNPDVFFVAEAYDTDPAKVPGGDPLIAQIGGGNIMFDLLASGFDAVYDDATYDMLKEIYDGQRWANDIDRQAVRQLVFDNSLRYAENHDEVRLAARNHWGNVGFDVGRPVSAILYGLSRGPVMLYHGQEVGEPAHGVEGFGGDDGRTSIFDYWSMPEFTKWVNGKKFDGGGLSIEQAELRKFYSKLLNLVNEPAFRSGDFIPFSEANKDNPAYGRLDGESASGHWLYSFLRSDRATGQSYLVVVNLHPKQSMEKVRVLFPKEALPKLPSEGGQLVFTEKLSSAEPLKIEAPAEKLIGDGLEIPSIPPLTPYYFEIGK
jgi:glycosidase